MANNAVDATGASRRTFGRRSRLCPVANVTVYASMLVLVRPEYAILPAPSVGKSRIPPAAALRALSSRHFLSTPFRRSFLRNIAFMELPVEPALYMLAFCVSLSRCADRPLTYALRRPCSPQPVSSGCGPRALLCSATLGSSRGPSSYALRAGCDDPPTCIPVFEPVALTIVRMVAASTRQGSP